MAGGGETRGERMHARARTFLSALAPAGLEGGGLEEQCDALMVSTELLRPSAGIFRPDVSSLLL